MVEPDAVLQVADGVLDLGVAAMVGLEVQRVAVAIGDEGVIAVGSEEGKLGAGRGPDPADDEPHRCGVGLATERDNCEFSPSLTEIFTVFDHLGSAVI